MNAQVSSSLGNASVSLSTLPASQFLTSDTFSRILSSMAYPFVHVGECSPAVAAHSSSNFRLFSRWDQFNVVMAGLAPSAAGHRLTLG